MCKNGYTVIKRQESFHSPVMCWMKPSRAYKPNTHIIKLRAKLIEENQLSQRSTVNEGGSST